MFNTYTTHNGTGTGDYFVIGRRCSTCGKQTLYLRIAADGSRSLICKSGSHN